MNGADNLRFSQAIVQALRCPVCGGVLTSGVTSFTCMAPACAKGFPVVEGIPVLLNESRSLVSISDYRSGGVTAAAEGRRKGSGFLYRVLPGITGNVCAARVLPEFASLVKQRVRGERNSLDPTAGNGGNGVSPSNSRCSLEGAALSAPAWQEPPRVLVLGGAEAGVGFDALLSDPAIELVETDIGFGSRTGLVCDAQDIPFADGTFDGVVAQAVLEYLPDPARAVAEIHRVLAPGGVVYAETPFMQQVHGGCYDFTRYTHLGHRRLFRDFSEIDSGIACGPGTALAWSWQYFLMSCCSSRSGRRLAFMAGRLTAFWLKYLDGWLSRKPAAYDAASGFYFLGRKAEVPLMDRALIVSYRGLI